MRAFILLIAFLICFPPSVHAADEVAAAQTIIRSQAEAFGRDDAAAAYGYAAPAIQQLFQQPETFMAMVRTTYPPVYRHKSFEFGDVRAADGKVAQKVNIVDEDGEPWEALYTLEQQPDGGFKITGCSLVKAIRA